MKTLLQVIVIAVAAGLGLGIGFAMRPESEPRHEHLPGTSSSPSMFTPPKLILTPAGTNGSTSPHSTLAAKLERDLSMTSGVTRWLYWLEALENATTNDFPRLARLAQGNATALRFVAARWVEVNPKHLFDLIARGGDGLPKGELAQALFQEWPKTDPEGAIAALSSTNGASNWGWRMNVVNTIIEKDVERGLKLMSEWNLDNYGPSMKAVAKWAAANPRHAAEFVLNHPSGYGSQSAMATIGKEWAKIDPAGALEFAAGQRDKASVALAETVLKQWAGDKLGEAADWLAQTDPATRNRLSPSFVEAWAKQDASSALAWCEGNLSGKSLTDAIGGVMKGAAAKDVAAAAELVSRMDPGPGRAQAAATVASKWLPDFSSNKPLEPETIEWMARLDIDSMKKVLEEVAWRWSESDPQSMSALLEKIGPENVPPHVASTLARRMARKDPIAAIEWAQQWPEDQGNSAASEAFSMWHRSQPEAALKWLTSQPAATPQRQTLLQSAVHSMAYTPLGSEQLATLPTPDRVAARKIIESMNLPQDRRATLLQALK